MTAIGSIRETWALLEGLEPRDLRVRVLNDTVTDDEGPAFAVGLDALGRRHLLVPIAPDRPVVEDLGSSGVQITRHQLEDNGETRTFVDVLCAKAHLNELFDIVADEMMAEATITPSTPDLACRRVLERWRELIEQEAGVGAGPERLGGLFAELWHLRRLAQAAPGKALDLWVGPLGSRHDFMGGHASMEVKASLSRHGRFPEIHSVEQLQPPIGAPLFLAMMKLERVAAAGETAGLLIDQIGDLGVDRKDLVARARQAGFQPEDLSVDHRTRFTITENLIYLVDDDFPAITPSSFVGGQVPAGVLRLRYLIDLSTGTPSPLEPEDVSTVYQLLAEA